LFSATRGCENLELREISLTDIWLIYNFVNACWPQAASIVLSYISGVEFQGLKIVSNIRYFHEQATSEPGLVFIFRFF
jgi:hypothetical protein